MFQWFSNLGMSVRVILATVAAIVVVVVANYVVFVSDYRESAERALEKEAAVFTAVADEVRKLADSTTKTTDEI